jgi:cation diffusion facilitator CzcD-associated flavoprotein CzcO
MAETAAHVTMLQRSPTYMVSRPSIDRFAPITYQLDGEQFVAIASGWGGSYVLFAGVFSRRAAKPM